MLASVSHELRTPLNCIIYMIEDCKESVSAPVWSDKLQLALSSAKALLLLIGDLLDFSQMEAKTLTIQKNYFSIVNAAHDVISLISIQASHRGVRINTLIDRDLPRQIFNDEFRFKQVIMNLLGNALKFTAEGSITLSITNSEHPDYTRVEVADTGATSLYLHY